MKRSSNKNAISALITDEAYAVYQGAGRRQGGHIISRSLVFFHNHGPSTIGGAYREREALIRNIGHLQTKMTELGTALAAAQAELALWKPPIE